MEEQFAASAEGEAQQETQSFPETSAEATKLSESFTYSGQTIQPKEYDSNEIPLENIDLNYGTQFTYDYNMENPQLVTVREGYVTSVTYTQPQESNGVQNEEFANYSEETAEKPAEQVEVQQVAPETETETNGEAQEEKPEPEPQPEPQPEQEYVEDNQEEVVEEVVDETVEENQEPTQELEVQEIDESELSQAQTINEETVVVIQEVDGSITTENATILTVEELETAMETPKPAVEEERKQKPRGRKPTQDIPLHFLGRNIVKPQEDSIPNGKALPKPRLGVKVPYINLTSQIVSKEEIQKEIMERVRQKQEQAAVKGDFQFARKLTQRLARKLAPKSEKDDEELEKQTGSKIKEALEESKEGKIDNSDLIAILEGEDDKDEKEEVKKKEREIALKQLEELPNLEPKARTYGNPNLSQDKNDKKNGGNEEVKTDKRKRKENPEHKLLKQTTAADVTIQKEVEDVPKVKANMVLKTYSRKRKSLDISEEKKSPSKESTSEVYMTKSSRIIKKKVIWDPDEAPKKRLEEIKSPIRKEEKKKEDEKKKEPEEKKKEEKKVTEDKKEKSPAGKHRKRLTEIDRLLMDEGAVNMLYDVKNTEETEVKKAKKVISLNKAHKELMKKTNEIKSDLQQSASSSISLRKKESTPTPSPKTPGQISRKRSKDSTRSSLHTPPASPSFNQSRLIRRRSSSSVSSLDENIDEIEEEVERVPRKKSEKKKPKKDEEEDVKKSVRAVESKLGQYKSFTLKKSGGLIGIDLNYINEKCYFSELVLKELVECLGKCSKEKDCNVVAITSSSKAFCLGVDYFSLVEEDSEKRKGKATQLANSIREFLKCLLHFPKVLVAGVQGDCVGLGVTMLPLFDLVIATDTATFSTQYGSLGCIAEAPYLLTYPFLNNNGLGAELLYASQKIKADDACRRGLVTKLCWPEKYQDELKSILTAISKASRQSLEGNKKCLRRGYESALEAIEAEGKELIAAWTSSECQKSFSKLA